MDESKAVRVRRVMSAPVTLSSDDPILQIADRSPSELDRVFRASSISQTVEEGLKRLSSREREVIERRFGLDGHRRQTLAELGKHLGLSRERVRQIEKSALVRLQHSRELLEIYKDLDVAQS